jgi:hypothetical protein
VKRLAEKEEKSKDKWVLGQVATQTAPAIQNQESGEVLSVEQALTRLLNNQEKLLKLL